jgi:hypothetical protein
LQHILFLRTRSGAGSNFATLFFKNEERIKNNYQLKET